MRIRKFVGKTMKEALANVKHELGPDAVILSAKETHRGLFATPIVEVSAGIEVEALDKKTPAAAPPPPPAPVVKGPAPLDELDIDRIVGPIKSEMRAMRVLVRQHVQANAGADIRSELTALRAAVEELQRVSESSRRMVDPLPIEAIAQSTALVAESNAHYVAVVGPSGVGKTTTIAKLASKDALVYRRQVALITLDVYRVGAVEQIRAYAELIGIPLEIVTDPSELAAAITRVEGADRVYIDTAGRGPTDLISQKAMAEALGSVEDLEILLAVAAGGSAAQIDQVIQRFAQLRPDRLVMTKCDEAESLAELVYAPARSRIPVAFITTGQRVPEDLETATTERLVELATNGADALAVAA